MKETLYELLEDDQKKKLGKNNKAKMTVTMSDFRYALPLISLPVFLDLIDILAGCYSFMIFMPVLMISFNDWNLTLILLTKMPVEDGVRFYKETRDNVPIAYHMVAIKQNKVKYGDAGSINSRSVWKNFCWLLVKPNYPRPWTGGSGYQQKDRKPSQNDKTEHGMEK
ncbi:hypothetical protein Tco_1088517, partial [Tanacetum coccineum]